MVRELAGWQPDRYQAVLRWPLREAFWAYLEKLREDAREQFAREQMMWCMLAPHTSKKNQIDQPKPPAILKDL